MKVIKQFYTHKNKKTYYVGDDYKGARFKEIEKYVELPKNKPTKKTK